MASQLFVTDLGGTTSSKLVVKRTRRAPLPVSEQTILIEVGKARRKLRGGASNRLAELREAAARRVRTMPDYDDPADEVAERTHVVKAFEGLQTDTAAWNAGA